ncbi:3-5 exonuclease [Pelomyxa schiedti]|nr:3-5 exonuclease [Pelomyxa schiedti]
MSSVVPFTVLPAVGHGDGRVTESEPATSVTVVMRDAGQSAHYIMGQTTTTHSFGVAPDGTTEDELSAVVGRLRTSGVVGLDVEWGGSSPCSPVGVIQLCGETDCIVLWVEVASVLPNCIGELLSDPNLLKSGVGIHSDTKRIWAKFHTLTYPCVDMQVLAIHYGYADNGTSLRALAQTILGLSVEKHNSIRCGNWCSFPLLPEQLAYAATDAWVSRELLVHLHKEQTSTNPCPIFNWCLPFVDVQPKIFKSKASNTENDPEEGKNTLKRLKRKEDTSISKKQESFKGVYQLQTKSGVVLHNCDEKRLKWYMSRGLAEITSVDPPQARLTYNPVPRLADSELFFIWTREACCVVCGREDSLSRYSVVPPKYRKFMPAEYKDGHSPNIVLVCPSCHTKALEGLNKMDEMLEKETALPLTAVSYQRHFFQLRTRYEKQQQY